MAQPLQTKGSASEEIIAPEILEDSFFYSIVALAQHEPLANVLEIGSSAGGGSTGAFVRGLSLNTGSPKLFCMEVSTPRFEALKKAYEAYEFVRCYNLSSVASSRVKSMEEVAAFYNGHQTVLNAYPLEVVQEWRTEGLSYMTANPALDVNGIQQIKQENGIEAFDLVLIDGSAFTGVAEMDDVYGATIIAMDDVNDIKCYEPRQRLLEDPAYALLAENMTLRNGFSIFYRVDKAPHLKVASAMIAAMLIPNPPKKTLVQKVAGRVRRIFSKS